MDDETPNKQINITNAQLTSSGNIHVGDDIRNISNLVIYLTTMSGYSNVEMNVILKEFESQLNVAQSNARDVKIREERYAASLERALNIALKNVHQDQRPQLLKLVGEWVAPVIARCKERDDYHSPYGTFCSNLIGDMCNSLDMSMSAEINMKQVMDWIFTTKGLLQRNITGYEKVNVVYLKALSTYFPRKTALIEPLGFYLVTKYPVTTEGIESYGFLRNDLFDLICITDNNLNGWLDIAHGENDIVERDGIKKVMQRLYRAPEVPKQSIMAVTFDENQMILWHITKPYIRNCSKYSIEIDFKIFSAFLMSMVSDFLSLGSTAINSRQAHEQEIDNLGKPLLQD